VYLYNQARTYLAKISESDEHLRAPPKAGLRLNKIEEKIGRAQNKKCKENFAFGVLL